MFLPSHATLTINLLVELTSYLLCCTGFFSFKVFVIKCFELVPINMVINKSLLY